MGAHFSHEILCSILVFQKVAGRGGFLATPSCGAPHRRFQTRFPAFKLLSGISVENFFCLINLTHFVGWTIFFSFCLLFVAILSLSEFPGALELFWGFL